MGNATTAQGRWMRIVCLRFAHRCGGHNNAATSQQCSVSLYDQPSIQLTGTLILYGKQCVMRMCCCIGGAVALNVRSKVFDGSVTSDCVAPGVGRWALWWRTTEKLSNNRGTDCTSVGLRTDGVGGVVHRIVVHLACTRRCGTGALLVYRETRGTARRVTRKRRFKLKD